MIKSASVKIRDKLKDQGIEIKAYDPATDKDIPVTDSKVVFIATPWKEFEDLEFKKDTVVIDAFGILKNTKGLKYYQIGKHYGSTVKTET